MRQTQKGGHVAIASFMIKDRQYHSAGCLAPLWVFSELLHTALLGGDSGRESFLVLSELMSTRRREYEGYVGEGEELD